MLALECRSNRSRLPGEALGKITGRKRKQRSKLHLSEPPCAPESPARPCCPPQPLSLPKFSSRVKRPPLVLSLVSHLGTALMGAGGSGGVPPIPTPSLNVSSSICSCREREQRKNGRAPGSINQRWRWMWSTAPSRGSAPASQRRLQSCSSCFGLTPNSGRTIWQQSLR